MISFLNFVFIIQMVHRQLSAYLMSGMCLDGTPLSPAAPQVATRSDFKGEIIRNEDKGSGGKWIKSDKVNMSHTLHLVVLVHGAHSASLPLSRHVDSRLLGHDDLRDLEHRDGGISGKADRILLGGQVVPDPSLLHLAGLKGGQKEAVKRGARANRR